MSDQSKCERGGDLCDGKLTLIKLESLTGCEVYERSFACEVHLPEYVANGWKTVTQEEMDVLAEERERSK